MRNATQTVVLPAPAKLNLFLEVLGKRGDGYHDIETLMTTLSLQDAVHFRARDEPAIEVTCRSPLGAVLPDIPDGRTNLAYRAA